MAQTIRLSKPGVDVLTATSPNDFYLHSDYPLLKVLAFGTFSFAVSVGETEIEHNLGYKPFVLVFSQSVDYDYTGFAPIISTDYYQHDWSIDGASASWWGYTKIYDNKIVIRVNQSDAEVDSQGTFVDGFYYIFYDEVP